MAIICMPYTSDAVLRDRKLTAAQMAKCNTVFGTSGVCIEENSLLCSKVAGTMNVSIAPGSALLAGHPAISTETEIVTLANGHGTSPRIDLVVFESNTDTGVRTARFVVVQGTPAANPVAPTLSLTDELYQQVLCEVTVPAGATTLDSATLVDKRTFMGGKHLHLISHISLGGTDGTVIWDSVNKKLTYTAAGCNTVQLAPIVYGTSANAPAGIYPAGTMYVQYTS